MDLYLCISNWIPDLFFKPFFMVDRGGGKGSGQSFIVLANAAIMPSLMIYTFLIILQIVRIKWVNKPS